MNDKNQGNEILKESFEEPDMFWIERVKEMLGESVTKIDSASKQMMAVTGIALGFYLHAIPFKELQSDCSTVSRIFYLIPFIFLLFSLIWSFLAFAPRGQTLHFTSEVDARRDIEEASLRKYSLFEKSFYFFLLGILAIIVALVHYFFFSGGSG